jgi:hypothetical protein
MCQDKRAAGATLIDEFHKSLSGRCHTARTAAYTNTAEYDAGTGRPALSGRHHDRPRPAPLSGVSCQSRCQWQATQAASGPGRSGPRPPVASHSVRIC